MSKYIFKWEYYRRGSLVWFVVSKVTQDRYCKTDFLLSYKVENFSFLWYFVYMWMRWLEIDLEFVVVDVNQSAKSWKIWQVCRWTACYLPLCRTALFYQHSKENCLFKVCVSSMKNNQRPNGGCFTTRIGKLWRCWMETNIISR